MNLEKRTLSVENGNQNMQRVAALAKNVDASALSLIQSAADPDGLYTSIPKIDQCKSLTFKAENTATSGSAQQAFFFDYSQMAGYTDGADIVKSVVTTIAGSTPAQKYDKVNGVLSRHAAICSGFKLAVKKGDDASEQFAENFTFQYTDVNGNVKKLTLQDLINLSENPNYQQDNILYVPYGFVIESDYLTVLMSILPENYFQFSPVIAGWMRLS